MVVVGNWEFEWDPDNAVAFHMGSANIWDRYWNTRVLLSSSSLVNNMERDKRKKCAAELADENDEVLRKMTKSGCSQQAGVTSHGDAAHGSQQAGVAGHGDVAHGSQQAGVHGSQTTQSTPHR
ncbi:hypothetical protein Tco_0536555 [Tanacetum coccineum]